MYNDESIILKEAGSLPSGWGALPFKNKLFTSLPFLNHLQKTNPAAQRYIIINGSSGEMAGGIFYNSRVPFCLKRLCWSAPVTICGIPMVYGSDPGFAPEQEVARIAAAMDKADKGFQMILGLNSQPPKIKGWAHKRHLITVDFHNSWENVTQYINAMRSDYRKQVVSSRKKWTEVEVTINKGDDFTESDYRLFLAMYEAAMEKSVPLSIDFFRKMPVEHFYIKTVHKGKELGWALLLPEGDLLYLLYIGYNVQLNKRYDVYINLLLEAINFTIEKRFRILKMGQTAELIKMRLGGMAAERHMLVRHTNPMINQFIINTDIFNYRKHFPNLNVFKKYK